MTLFGKDAKYLLGRESLGGGVGSVVIGRETWKSSPLLLVLWSLTIYTMWASASWCFVCALPIRVDCMPGTVRQDKQFLCPSCLVLHHTKKTRNKICFYTHHRINPSAGLWGDVKPQGSKWYQNCRKASKSRENPSLHSQMWTPVCILCPRQFAFLTHGSQLVSPST